MHKTKQISHKIDKMIPKLCISVEKFYYLQPNVHHFGKKTNNERPLRAQKKFDNDIAVVHLFLTTHRGGSKLFF